MKIFFLHLLAALLLFSSCDKDDETETCDQNPLENIAWLKEFVNTENHSDRALGLEIIQYTYKNNTAFLVNDCVNDCADALTVVYDCDKNVLCEFGGVTGVNTCPNFDTEAVFVSVLYSSRINESLCDKGVIISKDLYDSTMATPIEEVSINGNCINITYSLFDIQDPMKDVMLIDSGAILESFPVQRRLKFVVADGEVRSSGVLVTTSFDISTLATWDEPEVILNIESCTDKITYIRRGICGDPNISCASVQIIDAKRLEYMLGEIKAISMSVDCENPDDWKITPIGSKACGGPQTYLAYSNKIDEIAFLEKVEAYKNAEEIFNSRWEIMSTCEVLSPPALSCESGKPVLVRM